MYRTHSYGEYTTRLRRRPAKSILLFSVLVFLPFLLLLILLSIPSNANPNSCALLPEQNQQCRKDSPCIPIPWKARIPIMKLRRKQRAGGLQVRPRFIILALFVTFHLPISIRLLTLLDTAFRQQRLKAWQ